VGQVSGTGKKCTFSGSASDNRGVTEVRVAIKNPGNGQWWHSDGTWGEYRSYPARLTSAGARTTSWSFSWTAPWAGSFGINATARDAAGNADSAPAWRAFTVTQKQVSFD
jgi:hypothetical protein